jgi:hypothetical protein
MSTSSFSNYCTVFYTHCSFLLPAFTTVCPYFLPFFPAPVFLPLLPLPHFPSLIHFSLISTSSFSNSCPFTLIASYSLSLSATVFPYFYPSFSQFLSVYPSAPYPLPAFATIPPQFMISSRWSSSFF